MKQLAGHPISERHLGLPGVKQRFAGLSCLWQIMISLKQMQECTDRFSGLIRDAEAGKVTWKRGYEGLAAVILMDQFSRYQAISLLWATSKLSLRE